MAEIIEIHVHYCKRLADNGRCAESEYIVEKPDFQEIGQLKIQIARIVEGLRAKNYVYFYVVLKARRSDGTIGYRPVIPKKFFKGTVHGKV